MRNSYICFNVKQDNIHVSEEKNGRLKHQAMVQDRCHFREQVPLVVYVEYMVIHSFVSQ
jgi:hypothetical protein